MVDSRNPLSHPRGLGEHWLPELQSLILGLLFFLFVWFPFFPGDPPPPKAELRCSQQRGPQGPSSRIGVGQRCHSHTSLPWEPPQSPASPHPQALPEPRHLGCLSLPSLYPPHPHGPSDHGGLDDPAVARNRLEGSILVAGGLGGLRGPPHHHSLFLCQWESSMEKRHSQPALLRRQE